MNPRVHRIKTIGYDIDGTMVDSEPLHVAAWREALSYNGRDFADLPLEFQNTMAGRKSIAIATFMVESLGLGISLRKYCF